MVFTTSPGMPAVLTPFAPELAQTTGFSLNAVLITQVIGFSTVVLPYQVGPLIVAMGLAGESTRPLLRVLVSVVVVTVLVLLPAEIKPVVQNAGAPFGVKRQNRSVRHE
jgi:hypothetical protein